MIIETCHACLDEQLCNACARKWAKLLGSVRLARECNHNYLRTRDRRYLTIRNEAMQDARYWDAQL